MTIGETSRKIQKRETPKDVFYTPEIVAKNHIEMIETKPTDIWYDDSKGKKIKNGAKLQKEKICFNLIKK